MTTMTPNAIAAARQAAYEDALHDYTEAMAREALEERHEAHGGDESPDRDKCDICRQSWEDFMLYGYDLDRRLGL